MKRFHLWMSRARLPLPEASSESARIRPRAEASGMVRNARRKLLPCKQVGSKGVIFSLGLARSSGTVVPQPAVHLPSFLLKCPRC